jgi:hypothetical protein
MSFCLDVILLTSCPIRIQPSPVRSSACKLLYIQLAGWKTLAEGENTLSSCFPMITPSEELKMVKHQSKIQSDNTFQPAAAKC